MIKLLNHATLITARMKRRKILSDDKAKKAKRVVKKTATKTMKATLTIVKVIFFLIIVYTIVVSFYLFITSEHKHEFLIDIATISIGGFWAFFLGYFGWRMGETLENYLHSTKKEK